MSISKNQIVYSILNTIRGGLVSNSEPISNEQLSFTVDIIRAKLVRQDLAKKRTLSQELIQTLCVNMNLADVSDCPCDAVGCTILKSTIPIPPAIEITDKNLVVSVGPIDLTKPRFNLLPYYRAIYYNPNKFSQSITGAFLHNQYLFVISKDNKALMLEKVNLQIVLEIPSDASLFSCSGISCYSDDGRYPISAAMVPDLQSMILGTTLKVEAVAPSDSLSDSKHNLTSNTEQ